MISMSLAEIATAVGGEVHDADPGLAVVGPAFLDSRRPVPGGLFVAAVGEHADGHDFAAGAIAAGAAAVLAARPVAVPAVVVDDVQLGLQRLAHEVLGRLRAGGGPTVIGITGSAGKTSVKDLLATVLGDAAPTVATQGSYNNEWGVPLTVLHAEESTRFLVLEMGARGLGHIAALCAIARPDLAIVLNVGSAHLGEFGSRAAIAQAKGELVEALSADGIAVLNADDELVAAMASRTRAQVVGFGTGESALVRLEGLALDELGRAHFRLRTGSHTVPVALRLAGAHQALNAVAAAAAAVALGLDPARVAATLGRIEHTSPWRMELTDLARGVLLINDSYNANPESMRAAIDAAVAIAGKRGSRVVAVLGEMLELGDGSAEAHTAVGRYAAEQGVACLIGVGPVAAGIVAGAGRPEPGRADPEPANPGTSAVSVPDRESALASLRSQLQPGDVVLVKASRGARMELLAEALIEEVGR